MQSVIRTTLITVVLSVITVLLPADILAQKKFKDPRPTIHAVASETAPEFAPLLDELRQAKREGNTAAAVRLHQQLGWVDPAASKPANASGANAEIVIRPNRPAHPDDVLKWGGDTLINDPGWSCRPFQR